MARLLRFGAQSFPRRMHPFDTPAVAAHPQPKRDEAAATSAHHMPTGGGAWFRTASLALLLVTMQVALALTSHSGSATLDSGSSQYRWSEENGNGTGNGTANGTGNETGNSTDGIVDQGPPIPRFGVSPKVANAFGGTVITLNTENITWTHRREIVIIHEGSNLTDATIDINLLGIEGNGEDDQNGTRGDDGGGNGTDADNGTGNGSLGIANGPLGFVNDNTEILTHQRLNGSVVRVAMPTLTNGSQSIWVAYGDANHTETTGDLSSVTPVNVSMAISEQRPNVRVFFGNQSGSDVTEPQPGKLSVISPVMPYGNHSIAIVLHDGRFFWQVDQLRHIPYFDSTGADQNWTVPENVTEVTLKLWGAGGGTGDVGIKVGGPEGNGYYQSGGAGGFVSGNLFVTAGEVLTMMVGRAGSVTSQTPVYSGGGWAGENAYYSSTAIRHVGGGGGLSGIFRGEVTQQNATIIAGGGGGGGVISQQYLDDGLWMNGGAAAWPRGLNGSGGPESAGGEGGGPDAGGNGSTSSRNSGGDGSAFAGGVSHISGNTWYGGGAGGAGWYGGGASGCFGPASQPGYTAGGGGGSSWYDAVNVTDFQHQTGVNESAPAADDPDYLSGTARGSDGGAAPKATAGSGLIVVLHEPESQEMYWAIGANLTNIFQPPPIETNDTSDDAPPSLSAIGDAIDSVLEFFTEDPESAVTATAATGGVALYVIFLRPKRSEKKRMMATIKGLTDTTTFHARLRALKVVLGSRSIAFILGPLAWAWDEIAFERLKDELVGYGINDVITLEGLVQYIVFEVIGVTFTTPAVVAELMPHVRNVCTFLFVVFLYLSFFTRGSIYQDARDAGVDQTEEVSASDSSPYEF